MLTEKTPTTEAVDGQAPAALARATKVTTRRTSVRLDQIALDVDRYCHRDPAALDESALTSLMDSLVLEKLQVPIEGYRDAQQRFVLVKGHRRVQSHHALARKNTPGFSADMELEAIELEDHTPQDLLVRSIADNEVRLNLDRIGRIRAAKKLYDGSVEEGRAAAALGVSPKTYRRDLLIAKHAWMFQHVIDGSIDATAATELLDAAEKAGRVPEVRDDLDAWIADQKRAIREKERLRKHQGGKDFAPSEKQVKRFLPRHLWEHWLELVKNGKRFDDDAEWDFAAHINQDKGQLHIGSVNLDLDKDPPEKIAKVASKLSLLSKQLAPVLRQRLAVGQKAEDREELAYDLDYLENLGAHSIAEHLKERHARTKEEADDGEAQDMEVPQERQETTLASQVELPPADLEEADPAAAATGVKGATGQSAQ